MSLYSDAEAYYEANKAKVDAVVAELSAAGAEDSALDDILHDIAADNGDPEDDASDVNNGGFAFQVSAILEGYGDTEGMERIRTAVSDASAAPTA